MDTKTVKIKKKRPEKATLRFGFGAEKSGTRANLQDTGTEVPGEVHSCRQGGDIDTEAW